jgi:hypothetical protein
MRVGNIDMRARTTTAAAATAPATAPIALTGYHPDRSRVSGHALADFIRAPVSGVLTEVPGVGPATAAKLAAHGVDTTFALIGKYLTFRTAGVSCIEHMDRFYAWLTFVDTASGFRAGTCQAIAEKVDTFLPGTYDPEAFIRSD